MVRADFEVKAGTAEPFAIREVDQGFRLDLELEARMACRTRVSAYDESRYAGDEEVKAQCCAASAVCLAGGALFCAELCILRSWGDGGCVSVGGRHRGGDGGL